MSNVIPMPTREDWERVETINGELAVKVINLLHERDVLVKAIAEIQAATLNGGICDDVAWFGPGETLYDFCERTLDAVGNARD